MTSRAVEVALSPAAVGVVGRLPDEARADLRRAFDRLTADPTCGVQLCRPLDGLRVLRGAHGLRMVYLVLPGRVLVLGVDLPAAALQRRPPRVAAVLLAAGSARHHGVPVQLHPVQRRPSLLHAAGTFLSAGADTVVLVLGARHAAVRAALARAARPGGLDRLILTTARQGRQAHLSSSLKAGLELVDPDVELIAVGLGDRPHVRPETVRALHEAYRRERPLVVRPFHRGVPGHPVLFAPSLRDELLRVRGDLGGRTVIAKHANETLILEVDDPGVVRQVGEEA